MSEDKVSTGNRSQEKLIEKFTEIEDNWLDVVRRQSVAERKREGHEIESIESIRLFRQGVGYLLRLQNISNSLNDEISKEKMDEYDVVRVIQHGLEYNRILKDLERNERFKVAVKSFTRIDSNYSRTSDKLSYEIDIEDYTSSKSGPIKGDYPEVRKIVAPQMKRLVDDLRDSLIGRIASGK